MLCIRSAIVVEQLVVCANLLIDLVHVFLNNRRKCIVVRVAGLSYLEEDIRVLSRTALTRVVRVQCILTECIDCIHICHIFQIFIIPGLDLLNLMGCTETIEEVNERNLALDGCQMCNRG